MNQWRTSRLKGTIQGPSAQQHSRISEHQRMRVWHKQLDSMLKPVLSLTIREGAARLANGPKACRTCGCVSCKHTSSHAIQFAYGWRLAPEGSGGMKMDRCKPASRKLLSLALSFGLALASTVFVRSHSYAAAPYRQEPRTFTKEIRKMVTINYLLSLPKEYGVDKDKRWPMILFLHGAGERGSDLNKVKALGPPKLVAEGKEMPFIIISPQAPDHSNWDVDALNALLDEIVSQYAVDEGRIYLTGVSMGGAGTWRLASAHPERFAAIAPICGWGDPGMAHRMRNMPIWVFHGAKDDLVPLQASQEMVEALKQVGNEPRFTVYPDAGHDSWTETYNSPALFEWFLKQKR